MASVFLGLEMNLVGQSEIVSSDGEESLEKLFPKL